MRRQSTDVLVIGGGPAGSTAATLLADRGYRVILLEKTRFPRDHVGESLLPFCYPIFRELGVLDEMIRRFVRKPGVRFVDTDGLTQTTWCFSNIIKDESYLSFHVIRAEFDEMLLDNAANRGVSVHQATRVIGVDVEQPGGSVEVTAVGPRGGEHRYRARFVVDASGRDTFLASRMGVKSPHDALDRAALSTHWAGAHYTGGIEQGLLQIVYLGGEKQGWIWAIPVGTDRVSAGVVINHSYLREQKRKFQRQGSRDWQTDLYQQELFTSPYLVDLLSDAHTILPIMLNGDYSYWVRRKYGRNFAMVGDAAAFIDPIFATGVYLSMNGARLLAGAIDARLSSGEVAGEAAMADVYARIEGAYGIVDSAIRMFYNPVALNFAQIGTVADVFRRTENMLAVGHFLIAGDLYERYDRYDRFLQMLTDPYLLRVYQKAVVERPEFVNVSCSANPAEIFSASMAEMEPDRERFVRRVSREAGQTSKSVQARTPVS